MAENAEKIIPSEIRSRNTAELISLRSAKVEELRKLRFKKALQGAQGAPIKTHAFKELRRDIARLNTVLGEQARGDTVTIKAKAEAKPKKVKAEKPAAEATEAKAEKPAKKEATSKTEKASAKKAATADGEKKAPAKKKTAKKGEE
jgi:ribosomal protein L29